MSRNERKIYKKKKKKKGFKTGLLVALAVLLFLSGFGYAYVHNLLNSTNQETITKDDEELGIGDKDFEYEKPDVEIPGAKDPDNGDLPFYYKDVEGVVNIALFGVDAPVGKNGRSDSIMIVTVDKNSKKIKISSIIRDSYVNIPGRGMDKVNHAYAFGGPELAIQTLNSNFHLDIRDFGTVNFTTLPKIIDILGGVEITVTKAEAPHVGGGLTSAGTYTLSGEQALNYSRIRKIDSDFARSERQRTVLEAIIKKMLNKNVTSYPGILSKILPLVTTNMKSNDILSLAGSVVTNGIRTIEQNRFPQEELSSGQTIKGVYYYVFNREQTIHNMGKFIYLDEVPEEDPETATAP